MTVTIQPPPRLTDKQRAVLRYIVDCIREGSPPSYRDLMRRFEWASMNAAKVHINTLIRKGFLTQTPGRAYGIEVVGLEITVSYASNPAGVRLWKELEEPH